MVEAVVAIPFFITIFVSMLYVTHLYAEKQRTLRDARQIAWTHALKACEGSTASTIAETNPSNDLGGAGENADPTADPSVEQYAGKAGGSELLQDWGTAVATSKSSVNTGFLLGSQNKSLSTTTRVQCNEKKRKGNLLGVLKMAWGLWKFW